MAVWDSASVEANAFSPVVLRTRLQVLPAELSLTEPEIPGKWHPGTTLAFIVASCGLLWGGIFAVVAQVF